MLVRTCGNVMSCDRNELKYSFFNVVNIEEKLHFTWRMTKLRNVSLKILLDLLRKIAKPKATHLVIPFDNRRGIFLRRVLTDPVIDFFVSRAGGNELLELHRVHAGELPKVSAQATWIEVVLAIDAEQIGPGFVKHPCGNDESAERVARAVRWCLP